jgi:excisionase family DNA binding protein
LYRTKEAAEVLALGETSVRALIRAGDLRVVSIGGIKRITAESLRAAAAVEPETA